MFIYHSLTLLMGQGGVDNPGDDMLGGGADNRCHPAENRSDLDIRGNTAGNVAGQTSAPNG